MNRITSCTVLFLFMFSLLCVNVGICKEPVNINTATEHVLKTLPGIGPVIAKRIVTYRTDHPFTKIDDIMQVKGIGPKLFEKIKKLIKV